MRFGIHLGNSGPKSTTQALVAQARVADESGYDSVWVSDHIVIPEHFESKYPFRGRSFTPDTVGRYYEPLITLAVMAGATANVRLGTSVLIIPQRNPVVMAKQIATLDELSGGRMSLGIGAGWLAEEFEVLGADFERRGSILEEWVEMFRAVWSQEKVSFEGSHYSFAPVRFDPRPAQIGGVPITIGGHSERAVRRAATMLDGWQGIHLSAAEVGDWNARVRAHAAEAGRDPSELHLQLRCGVALTDGSRPEGIDPWLLMGGPEEVASGIREYADAGVTELIFSVAGDSLQDVTETITRLAEEVLPSFRSPAT